MKKIAEKQQEWAQLKYLILSKSQQDYQKIRALFSKPDWTEEKEQQFQGYITHALATVPSRGNSLNAYQHIWGYFKNKATDEERAIYEQLLATYSLEADELRPFLQQLTYKYKDSYLSQSALLFPDKLERKRTIL